VQVQAASVVPFLVMKGMDLEERTIRLRDAFEKANYLIERLKVAD
jgi:hypothetical protein